MGDYGFCGPRLYSVFGDGFLDIGVRVLVLPESFLLLLLSFLLVTYFTCELVTQAS